MRVWTMAAALGWQAATGLAFAADRHEKSAGHAEKHAAPAAGHEASKAEDWFTALPEYPYAGDGRASKRSTSAASEEPQQATKTPATAPALPAPDAQGERPSAADGAPSSASTPPAAALKSARFAAKGEAVPAAFFRRGSVYWAALAAPEVDDEKALLADPPAPFLTLTRLPHPSYAIYYGKLRPETREVRTEVRKEPGGRSSYVVEDADAPGVPERPVPVKMFSGKLTGSFVRFGGKPLSPPLRFRDPLVGDELLALLYPAGRGVPAPGKEYPDFAALPSDQGAALALRSDAVHYEPDGDGLTVAGPADRLVSDVQAALRELQEQEEERNRLAREASQNTDRSFLKFHDWRQGDDDQFRRKEGELTRAVAEAGTQAARSKARLNLARFYFAHGFKTEAVNVIGVLREKDPAFAEKPEVTLPEGAAYFLEGRYPEALAALEKAAEGPFEQEADKQEAKFWLDAAKLKLHIESNLPEKILSSQTASESAVIKDAPGAPFRASAPVPDVISNIESFLRDYPKTLVDDLNLLALEGYLRMNRPVEAESLLGLFDQEDMRPSFRNARKTLEGAFAAKEGREDEALAAWESAAGDPDDRLNRTRALLLSTLFRYRKHLIDAKQAIEILDKARSGWRGGPEELNVLKTLGELYFHENDYYNGFKVWREAAKRFAGHEDGLTLAKRLSEKFAQIFAAKDGAGMPDLETLTLFYEFRDLTPLGKAGDQIISSLADRLIALDLLDRAAALLEHQARYRLQGKERDEAVFKLADVRMRDRHPEQALEALNAFGSEASDAEAGKAMRYMQARALTELGKYNRALKLLENDLSPEASYLRAEVFWRNGVWKHVAEELEPVFRSMLRAKRVEKGAPLDKKEARELVRLAVSYALLNRREATKLLREDFTPWIPPGSDKKLFDFVTAENVASGLSPDELLQSENVSGFLDDYLNNSSRPSGATPGEALPSPSTPTPGQRPKTNGG